MKVPAPARVRGPVDPDCDAGKAASSTAMKAIVGDGDLPRRLGDVLLPVL